MMFQRSILKAQQIQHSEDFQIYHNDTCEKKQSRLQDIFPRNFNWRASSSNNNHLKNKCLWDRNHLQEAKRRC